jgi:hypothetical protein
VSKQTQKQKKTIDEQISVVSTESKPALFPEVEKVVRAIKGSCDYIKSQTFIEYPEDFRGRPPIFHAHVFLDRREYTISLVPSELDGPDAK